MARSKTLLKLLDDFRAECRLSLNPAHNAQQRETQVKHLQRVQEWLYDDFDWPHLRVERLIAPQAGQRYYALPDDIALERIQHLEVRYETVWMTLQAGIEPGHYAAYDSDGGMTNIVPYRWRIWEDDQIELWPVPNTAGDPTSLDLMVKVVGIKRLAPLVDDADRCALDDRLIVLYAAAEYLAANSAADAKLKLDQANKRYASIKADLTPRRRITLFGGDTPIRVLRGMPSVQVRSVDTSAPGVVPPVIQPPAGGSPNGVDTITANAAIVTSGHRAVRQATDGVRVCSPYDITQADTCIGITQGAAQAGQPVTVQTSGLMTDAGWSWANGPIFLGADGVLTQTPPKAAFEQRVGVAAGPTALVIEVEPVIITPN